MMILQNLAPKVYKHRSDIMMMNFASEAFTNGGKPNIQLYKDQKVSKRSELI